eukprot:CAMPEP_0115018778 /NCGR_PEP_ID=MMETSP0216-20121206/29038_1 /TAXON_ID=223996 /ORGANISM="Protocruzia adherens, Strain Boccale" /LENGTH=235 /DNA_ID=CAMNT_0002390097 /DNA_START=234 /DNA_END=938 /DNA_ORIENTATION=+
MAALQDLSKQSEGKDVSKSFLNLATKVNPQEDQILKAYMSNETKIKLDESILDEIHLDDLEDGSPKCSEIEEEKDEDLDSDMSSYDLSGDCVESFLATNSDAGIFKATTEHDIVEMLMKYQKLCDRFDLIEDDIFNLKESQLNIGRKNNLLVQNKDLRKLQRLKEVFGSLRNRISKEEMQQRNITIKQRLIDRLKDKVYQEETAIEEGIQKIELQRDQISQSRLSREPSIGQRLD